jgi:hypothetical protein
MTKSDTLHKDVVGGVLMSAVGLAVAVYSVRSLNIGELSRMGPGYFPLALGVILFLSGVAIALKARASAAGDSKEHAHLPEWKAWILMCVAIGSFVLLAKSVGLAVATFSIVFISALGDRKNTWKSATLLALAMVIVSVVVFWWALKIQLPLFKWGHA